MSNPAVITLDSEKSGCLSGFRVEDNIGEAIHIHFDEIRLDFTIKEYLDFAESVKESIEGLSVFGEELYNLPYDFLKRYSDIISDYEKIETELVCAKDLFLVEEINLFNKLPLKIKQKIYKSKIFKKNAKEVKSDIDSLPFCDSRFIKTKIELINAGKRPELILFNGSNIIRDGKLLALAYVCLYGLNYNIPVKRVYLKQNFQDRYVLENVKSIIKVFGRKIISKIKNFSIRH